MSSSTEQPPPAAMSAAKLQLEEIASVLRNRNAGLETEIARLRAALELAEARPARIHVVSDSGGFVGAFLSQADVANVVLVPYPEHAFVIQVFPVASTAPLDTVHVIPYTGCDAVAFVSNDIAKCKAVHKLLASIGMTYDDDIDYWKQETGKICPPAKRRLDLLKKGSEVAAELLEEKLFASLDPMKGGPIERALKEAERVTIMDSIVMLPSHLYLPTKPEEKAPSAITYTDVEREAIDAAGLDPDLFTEHVPSCGD